MMAFFKEWCDQELGITNFTEGKITSSIFFQALPGKKIELNDIIKQANGFLLDTPYMRGLVISVDDFQSLKINLLIFYCSFVANNQKRFAEWLQDYFYRLGIDLSKKYDYKEPSNIHLTFSTIEYQHSFFDQFASFHPTPSINPLTFEHTLQLPSHIISHLQQLYYQRIAHDLLSRDGVQAIRQQIQKLNDLKNRIIHSNLILHLDFAHDLSRDFTNFYSHREPRYTVYTISAYALSLKVYAEVNQDNLSPNDYKQLVITSSLLAAYDESGCFKQSLITDSYFIDKLVGKLFAAYTLFLGNDLWVIPVLKELPETKRNVILTTIHQNTMNMLHGTSSAPLGDGAHFRMLRFLPDKYMRSETDELIFQGGGMSGHSAVVRIIKVGILANGLKAELYERPLYYEYYKVVDNLGVGSKEIDSFNKICTGTHVSRLFPYALVNDIFVAQDINPSTLR